MCLARLCRTMSIALGALIVLVTDMPAAAQTNEEIQILQIEEGDGAVSLEIAIPPAIGDVAPLASNFGLTVDGEVTNFELRLIEELVDVVVLIDTSGSMQGEALLAAQSAALAFVEQLPSEAQVAIIGFGATATVVSPLGTDKNSTRTAIGSLQAVGETALWDGLVTAADVLRGSQASQPYVVVLSDGDDTVSRSTQAVAIENLASSGAGLYAVTIESPDSDGERLEAAVEAVGGQFFATTDPSTLDRLYRDIASRLANRYVLEFDPGSVYEQTVVVSVAVAGQLATARGIIGAGHPAESASLDVPPVINLGSSAELARFVGPTVGFAGSSAAFVLGMVCLFGSFLLIAVVVVVPDSSISLNSGARGKDRMFALNGRVTGATERLVSQTDHGGSVDGFLDAAGVNLRAGEFVLITVLVTAVAGLFGVAMSGLFLGAILLAGAAAGCYVYISARTARRRSKFADQLTDALGIMTGSLRSGRGLPQAIELVAQEAPSPTDEEFRRIVFETRVGRDLTDSMSEVATRMNSEDLKWVTRAVDINRDLGGDLTELLDNVAATIRERRQIARHVQALSAEGRMSGWVLLALPVVMFLFQMWRTPESASLMTQTNPGRSMLGIGMLGMFLGYLWIRKLVDVKY